MSCPNTLVVAFDLETTGLNAMNDCIIQLAATVLESHRSLQSRDTFTIYCCSWHHGRSLAGSRDTFCRGLEQILALVRM